MVVSILERQILQLVECYFELQKSKLLFDDSSPSRFRRSSSSVFPPDSSTAAREEAESFIENLYRLPQDQYFFSSIDLDPLFSEIEELISSYSEIIASSSSIPYVRNFIQLRASK